MGAALLSVQQNNLQHARHEYRAAHEQEDNQAGQPLLSDAQEARLLPRGRALRLQLQAVDVGDGQDSGCHEPGKTHDGAHGQHHAHHQKVQVVPATFLCDRERDQSQTIKGGALALTSRRRHYWQVGQLTGFCFFLLQLTSSLCSFRLMMTAVICWSMKIRMVQRRAGIEAARTVHHGLGPIGLMNHPRSSLVGWWCPRE